MWDDQEPGWSTGQAFDQPVTDATITTDAASARAGVDNSGQQSQWGGFGALLDKVVSYGIQKDAAQSSVQLQQQRAQALQMQPLVAKTSNGVAVNSSGLLLIGGIVLAVIVLSHGGKG
jgi:hypothetical protein